MASTKGRGIVAIALEGIDLIEDAGIRHALFATYKLPRVLAMSDKAERLFKNLTATSWPKEKICRFISGWRSTHGTALYVSGLMIRLLREAKQTDGIPQSLLYEVTGEVGEIIPEDTGVDDIPHQERFAIFADNIAGSDEWRLTQYSSPACDRFRNFVQEQRLKAPIDEAILTTAASENWNTGEYTFFAERIGHWLTDILKMDADKARDAAAYVVVHSGNTEKGHFLHAIKAWQMYCDAHKTKPDPQVVAAIFQKYLFYLEDVYGELSNILG